MSNESCLLDLLAAACNGNVTCRGKPSGSVFVNTNVASWVRVAHCEEFDPVLVHRAKMEEKDFTGKMGVYDVVSRSDAAEKGCRVIRTRWVTVNKGSDDAPQVRARWVAQEFRDRCGDKHEYFSETHDLAFVKAVIAHAARRAESEDIVVAVFVLCIFSFPLEWVCIYGLLSQVHPTLCTFVLTIGLRVVINWISEKSIVNTCKMFSFGVDFFTASLPRIPSQVVFSLYFGFAVSSTMAGAFLDHVVQDRGCIQFLFVKLFLDSL